MCHLGTWPEFFINAIGRKRLCGHNSLGVFTVGNSPISWCTEILARGWSWGPRLVARPVDKAELMLSSPRVVLRLRRPSPQELWPLPMFLWDREGGGELPTSWHWNLLAAIFSRLSTRALGCHPHRDTPFPPLAALHRSTVSARRPRSQGKAGSVPPPPARTQPRAPHPLSLHCPFSPSGWAGARRGRECSLRLPMGMFSYGTVGRVPRLRMSFLVKAESILKV